MPTIETADMGQGREGMQPALSVTVARRRVRFSRFIGRSSAEGLATAAAEALVARLVARAFFAAPAACSDQSRAAEP